MKKLLLVLSLGILVFACKESKKETKQSPYQALADQYAEFPLTTDVSKLTENEKKIMRYTSKMFAMLLDTYAQKHPVQSILNGGAQ
mgnify:CR=1 FL=1